MSGIFSSAADNRRMGWKSCISATLGRVTHEDWSQLGFTSSARGALEEHIIQVRCSDSPRGVFAEVSPESLADIPCYLNEDMASHWRKRSLYHSTTLTNEQVFF